MEEWHNMYNILIFVLEKNDVCFRKTYDQFFPRNIKQRILIYAWTIFFVSQEVKFKFPTNISDIKMAAYTHVPLLV